MSEDFSWANCMEWKSGLELNLYLDPSPAANAMGKNLFVEKLISAFLSPAYTCNFLLAIAMQFQEIIALPSHVQSSVCTMSLAGIATSEKLQEN